MNEDAQIAARIAQRFRKRSHAGYARGKVRYDPAYAAVAGWIGADETPLLDVGCGLGLLGLYLRERGWRGAYRGLDFDSAKIAAAKTSPRPKSTLANHVYASVFGVRPKTAVASTAPAGP